VTDGRYTIQALDTKPGLMRTCSPAACVCVCVFVCVWLCMCLFLSPCVCVWLCICVCLCTCVDAKLGGAQELDPIDVGGHADCFTSKY
jgi:hypothetical protein